MKRQITSDSDDLTLEELGNLVSQIQIRLSWSMGMMEAVRRNLRRLQQQEKHDVERTQT